MWFGSMKPLATKAPNSAPAAGGGGGCGRKCRKPLSPKTKKMKEQPAPKRVPAERFALDAKKFPLLAQLGRNLTELAAKGELDPVVGRDAEIERALDVLAKRQANNACLVGAFENHAAQLTHFRL